MGAGIVTGKLSFPWQNATQGQVGYGVALTADEQVNLATANTDAPFGVLTNSPKQSEFAAVAFPGGGVVEAVCGAAITTTWPNLVTVTVDGTGRFIVAAKTTTAGVTTKEYAWGWALKSTTAAGQKFPLLFHPFEMEIT